MNTMQGKTVLVTGANSGIGFGTVIGLAKKGAHVIMHARSRAKGETAMAEAKQKSGSSKIDLVLADLSLQSEVRRLAEAIDARYEQLDVLVNNAAIIPAERETTAEGYEMQFAVNHLAYFLLTNLLLPKLIAAGSAQQKARIINVASSVHTDGKIDFNDLQHERQYNMAGFPMRGWQAYSNTKLMNVLFTKELARRVGDAPVTVNALHPGVIATNLTRTTPAIFRWIYGIVMPSPEKGAQTSIYLASSPDIENVTGAYFADSSRTESSPASQDQETARRLWEVSAKMTQIEENTMVAAGA